MCVCTFTAPSGRITPQRIEGKLTAIRGIAILNDLIFLIRTKWPKLEVYDATANDELSKKTDGAAAASLTTKLM